MVEYRLIQVMSPALVGLDSEPHGRQMWCKGRLRKTASCSVCRRGIEKGSEVFRPMGNGNNRWERIHAACMSSAIDVALKDSPAAPEQEKESE